MREILIPILCIAASLTLKAQKLPIEVLVGHKAVNTQLIINKKFTNESPLGFFSIVNFNMPYDKENLIFKYYMLQSSVYAHFSKNFRVFGGGFTNNIDYGAIAGVQGVFPFKNSFLLINNGHYLVKNYASQLMILFEYRPQINEKTSLYTRLQVMGETDFKVFKRGFQQIRVGLSRNNFQYGLGATFDQFGNKPITQDNVGLFIRTEF